MLIFIVPMYSRQHVDPFTCKLYYLVKFGTFVRFCNNVRVYLLPIVPTHVLKQCRFYVRRSVPCRSLR